ncbi:hypothetical protein OKW35_002414 [Paraburkholderia sp. MM5477-R1]
MLVPRSWDSLFAGLSNPNRDSGLRQLGNIRAIMWPTLPRP